LCRFGYYISERLKEVLLPGAAIRKGGETGRRAALLFNIGIEMLEAVQGESVM